MSLISLFGHDLSDPSKAATIGTIHHLIYVVFGALTIFLILKYAKKIRATGKDYHLKRYWLVLLVVLEIAYHVHNWTYPRFSIPLHICSFAVFMSIFLLLTDSKKIFNYVFFIGTLGGAMALLVPNSWGYSYYNFRYYHFIILHCSIMAVPLYYYKAYDYRVSYQTLLSVFKTIVVIGVCVHLINLFFQYYGIDSNYWFITYIPDNVDNVFHSYPLYIVTFISAVFLTMNILYFATRDKLTIELTKKEKEDLQDIK
jgi:hypothetical integral membrane protein (TIGR02206 family)